MLFNTIHFLWFFVIVYGLYWLLRRRPGAQNVLLLGASYFFYGYWDWRFLGLILLSTVIDYCCGIAMDAWTARRKVFVSISVIANLGILGFFKYFNFFVDSLNTLLENLGLGGVDLALSIILPVGISFYTFQTLSYTIDRYRGTIPVERNFLRFAVFVSMFPQLVAGPIVRAAHLLPQLGKKRNFSWEQQATGVQLILWGLFKKAVVADNLAPLVNAVFYEPSSAGIAIRVVAVYAFAAQIYCDFSGYSDIARGTAKLLGFEFPLNFRMPYFARDPSAFWRRWHISLSTWLRDYLYISLGGNRLGRLATYRNLAITMILGGLWHGASVNFVLWGAYQGLLLMVHRAWRDRWARTTEHGLLVKGVQLFLFFQLVCFGWLLFRASSIERIFDFFTKGGLFTLPPLSPFYQPFLFGSIAAVIVLIWDLLHEKKDAAELPIERSAAWLQAVVFLLLYSGISFFGRFVRDEFIYFQF